VSTVRIRFLLWGLFALAPAAWADDLGPCRPGEQAHVRAREELASLDTAISNLEAAAPTKQVMERLDALTASQCFRLIKCGGCGCNHRGSAVALKEYWTKGGRAHLQSFLDLGKSGQVVIAQPPSLRETLGYEKFPPGHPLNFLVCPPGDPACGAEARPWASSVQAILDSEPRTDCRDQPDGRDVPVTPAQCAPFAEKAPRPSRFQRFTDCLALVGRTQRALPLGHLRAPMEGWLVVAGRRGHYQFCDEVRAFDLTTGAHVRIGSCSGLALRRGGWVDGQATDRGRQAVIQLGHVSVGAIREVAWTLLMAGTIQREVRLHGAEADVPPEMARSIPSQRRDAGAMVFARGCFLTGWSSNQTRLHWAMHLHALAAAEGTVTWPEPPHDTVLDHAVELLQGAEDTFVPGCPRATPARLSSPEGPLGNLWRRALDDIEACSIGSP
jgi:hypothetical protein